MITNISIAVCGLLLVAIVEIVNDKYIRKLEDEYDSILDNNRKFLQQLKEGRDA